MNHPILSDYRSRVIFAGIIIFVIISQAMLVYFFTSISFVYSVLDSLVFNAIFAFCVIPLWYPVYYIRWKERSWYFNAVTHLAIIGLLLLVWLGSGYLLMELFSKDNSPYSSFLKESLSMKMVQGVFFYIIAVLSYFLFLYMEKLKEKEKNEIRLNKLVQNNHLLDRIAVKDRQQIHVIPVQEIHYIEACGDYVSLFTASGSFLKEKTMKYFEENLPSRQFVRIHRSNIINVNEVLKIELYEKESYRVYLKNGKILKASFSGYKALKEVVVF